MSGINGRYGHNGVDLPPADTKRWVKSRKLAVIRAIAHGILTDESACERYNLSVEELESWKQALRKYGPDALKATRLKHYRSSDMKTDDFHISSLGAELPG